MEAGVCRRPVEGARLGVGVPAEDARGGERAPEEKTKRGGGKEKRKRKRKEGEKNEKMDAGEVNIKKIILLKGRNILRRIRMRSVDGVIALSIPIY
jgi:hypothetical protein